jgi:hypothetical protein
MAGLLVPAVLVRPIGGRREAASLVAWFQHISLYKCPGCRKRVQMTYEAKVELFDRHPRSHETLHQDRDRGRARQAGHRASARHADLHGSGLWQPLVMRLAAIARLGPNGRASPGRQFVG